jgi:hypothetical protein
VVGALQHAAYARLNRLRARKLSGGHRGGRGHAVQVLLHRGQRVQQRSPVRLEARQGRLKRFEGSQHLRLLSGTAGRSGAARGGGHVRTRGGAGRAVLRRGLLAQAHTQLSRHAGMHNASAHALAYAGKPPGRFAPD